MAVTKLSNSGIKTGVLKYDSMLAGNAAFDPAATWLIQRVNGTGSSATITFSNIPQTYQHLQIRTLAQSTSTSATSFVRLQIQFNSDTGANYVTHYLQGTGGAVSAASITSGTNIEVSGAAYRNTTATDIYGTSIIDLHDYASTTKNKTLRSLSGGDNNSTNGLIFLSSGLWLNTNAISSITITAGAGNFTTASTFALYGFKGA